MTFSKHLLLCCLLLISVPLFAQIQIDFPKDRTIFQQSQLGEGHIFASATSSSMLDSLVWVVESHAIPSLPIYTGRFRSERAESGHLFQQRCLVPGGWYRLRAQGYVGGILVEEVVVERVGMGEVFLIAGQSNAQGQGQGAKSSVDPWQRVGTILGNDPVLDGPPLWSFHEILSHFVLYPMGITAWCWGELGDLLVQRRKVPVLFLNAALGETTSAQWANSLDGNGGREGYPGHVPYHYLKTTLQFYQHILGFRAILWHQGETDTFFPSASYFNNLKKVIEGTRGQSTSHLAWVVSRVSHILGQNRAQTIEDQNRIIAELPSVFPGPETDALVGPLYRSDGIHFSNLQGAVGLTALADLWNQSLTDEFFRLSEPVLPKLPFASPCGGEDPLTWVEEGAFSAQVPYVRDARGNYNFSTILEGSSPTPVYWTSPEHDKLVPGDAQFLSAGSANASQKLGNTRTTLSTHGFLLLSPGFEVYPGTVVQTQVTPCGN